MTRIDDLLGVVTFAAAGMLGAIALQPLPSDAPAVAVAPVVTAAAPSNNTTVGHP